MLCQIRSNYNFILGTMNIRCVPHNNNTCKRKPHISQQQMSSRSANAKFDDGNIYRNNFTSRLRLKVSRDNCRYNDKHIYLMLWIPQTLVRNVKSTDSL